MFRFGLVILTFLVLTISSCDTKNSGDSEEIAEEKNEQKPGSENLEKDWEFLVSAASDVLMEIELCKLAEQNAGSPKIKELSQTLMNDNIQVVEDLKILSAKKNVSIPNIPGDKYDAFIKKLSQLKGKDFDVEYLKILQITHEEDLERYQEEAVDGKDPEIRAFAAGKVQGLTQHLSMTKALHQTITAN